LRLSYESLKERKNFLNATAFFPPKGAIAYYLALPNYFYHFKCRLEIGRVFSEPQREFEEVELCQIRNSTGGWSRNNHLKVRAWKNASLG